MMVSGKNLTVVGAKVDPGVKARLIQAAADEGKTVNQLLGELIEDYLNNREKLTHPEKVVLPEPERFVIVDEDEDEDFDPDEFAESLWDWFVAYARDRGYRLIKRDTFDKLLRVLKLQKESKAKDEKPKRKEEYECGNCGYKSATKFKYCPQCGELNRWEK